MYVSHGHFRGVLHDVQADAQGIRVHVHLPKTINNIVHNLSQCIGFVHRLSSETMIRKIQIVRIPLARADRVPFCYSTSILFSNSNAGFTCGYEQLLLNQPSDI